MNNLKDNKQVKSKLILNTFYGTMKKLNLTLNLRIVK